MVKIVLAGCCATLWALSTAQAESAHDKLIYSLGFGVMAHDVDLDWAHDGEEDGVDYNLELIFRQTPLGFWQGRIYPNLGLSVNDRGATSKVYAGLLWRRPLVNRVTFSSGLGIAVHDGETGAKVPDTKQLGSRVVFRIPLELSYDFDGNNTLTLVLEHVSNASIETPNEGMDSLGVRYQYRF